MKVLVVEDDADLLDVTTYSLRRERFAVIEASDGAQALHRWKVDRPDLVVLDLGLPRQDGFEVLRRIRESDTTPVLVLTGRTEEEDIIRCFSLGSDDYMTKPFSAKVLAMRIRAILRRASSPVAEEEQPVLEVGEMRLDPEVHEVRWRDRNVRLTPIEFRIFHLLAMNAGRIVTTGRLLAFAWGPDGGDVSALRTHISHIRDKLELRHQGTGSIAGVAGIGYSFRLAMSPTPSALGPKPVQHPQITVQPA